MFVNIVKLVKDKLYVTLSVFEKVHIYLAEPQPSLALVIVVTVLAVAVVIFTAVMVIVINCLCQKIKNLKKELARARAEGQVEDGNDELNTTHRGVLDGMLSVCYIVCYRFIIPVIHMFNIKCVLQFQNTDFSVFVRYIGR